VVRVYVLQMRVCVCSVSTQGAVERAGNRMNKCETIPRCWAERAAIDPPPLLGPRRSWIVEGASYVRIIAGARKSQVENRRARGKTRSTGNRMSGRQVVIRPPYLLVCRRRYPAGALVVVLA